ncbi:hypothetical protein [Paenibacillus dendritiformis]|uniref:hypothetical protein n=1 Tax=Paenibacillus dendritiformis TaxID=130049 RepID=UPI00387E1D5B
MAWEPKNIEEVRKSLRNKAKKGDTINCYCAFGYIEETLINKELMDKENEHKLILYQFIY